MSTTRFDPNRKVSNISDPALLDQMLQEGDRIGHCKVIALIAAGGMANVYKVWHEQLEVVRAIKILKPGFNDESRGRLETEAKISANLRHGNIVEIYGMGYWNSIPYIEMEFVDGPSLKDLIETYKRLPVHFAIALSHFVCIALQYAYNRDMTLYGKVYDGLIHRDIKPANILITSQGKIKLADFGIARPSEVSLHTVGTKVMGTFAYLSPEQLNGEKLDQRSDVYSLGAVLYEMITGVKTFPQKLLAELIQKKSKGNFVPLENTGIQLPKHLCSIVEKSLNLDKNRRYFNAQDFDQELMNVLRKLTSQPAEEVIRDFLQDPYTSTSIKSIQKKRPLKIIHFLIPILILVILSGCYFLFKIINSNLQREKATLVQAQEKNTVTVEQQPVSEPQPVVNKPRPASQTVNTKSQQTTQESDFAKACKAFEENDYSRAQNLFESLSPGKLSTQQQATMNQYLLEIYIKNKETGKALNIAQNARSHNAHFYMLCADLYSGLKRYNEAIEALETARLYTNKKTVLKKIILNQARISELRYMMKPNRDNKQSCWNIWNTLSKEVCEDAEASSECQEAREKSTKYSD